MFLRPDARDRASERLWTLAIGVAAAVLYVATCCRGVYWYDSAEYATAAYTLGVPHPPGYPLYTLVAHGFIALLPLSPAHAINVMSACFAALAVALCFCSACALGAGRLAALASAALLGGGDSFWLNASIAEVYAPGLCCVFAVLLLLLRAQTRASPPTAILGAALAGLSLGVHYSIATLGLGWAWLAAQSVAVGASASERARQLAALAGKCMIAALAGYACAFVYVLDRADGDGVPNQASPLSLSRLLWLLSGGNYRSWFTHDDLLARAVDVIGAIALETSPLGLGVALLGLAGLAGKQRASAIAIGLAILGNIAFFLRYRVDDLEVFLLPSVALLCACAGVGMQLLADWLAARAPLRRFAQVAPALLLAIAGVRMAAGYAQHDLSRFDAAERYAMRLVNGLPRAAVIVHYATPEEWKYHAVFGLYFQHVVPSRRDVVVVANLDRPMLDRLLQEGRAVYLYTRVEHVAREYAMEPDGDLFRLLSRFER